ncbi:MAG: hypothetical protein LBB17_02365, partial [Puniceicoccales bacterium]|nr:hypothetical protein [Puniceicoccales bacterium]
KHENFVRTYSDSPENATTRKENLKFILKFLPDSDLNAINDGFVYLKVWELGVLSLKCKGCGKSTRIFSIKYLPSFKLLFSFPRKYDR